MHGLFKELAREIKPRFGRVDVLVEIEHQVVRHDRIAGGEEGDQALDKVDLGGREARAQVDQVGREVDFFDGPGVLDAVSEHVEEDGILHRPQGEAEAWVEDVTVVLWWT